MTTTLDLPDDLMMRVKARAEREHKQINEVLREWIEAGFQETSRSLEVLPPLMKLRSGFKPTTEDIDAAIEEGRNKFDTFS